MGGDEGRFAGDVARRWKHLGKRRRRVSVDATAPLVVMFACGTDGSNTAAYDGESKPWADFLRFCMA